MSGAATLMAGAEQTAFWRAAYESHGPSVLAFLCSRVGNRADAEELLQETFVRAIRAGSRLRERDKVRGYLFTTAHNLLCNHARRCQTSPVVAGGIEDQIEDTEPADARARLHSLCARLDTALDRMSPDHRLAFELGVLEKMPYREIAERTGWSPSQVKINVFRARKQALAELADYFPPAGAKGETS